MARLEPNELVRQAVHIGAGFLAFGVRWLGPLPLAGVALAGVVFNAVVLPRVGGRWLWRSAELRAERAPGMVFYPLSVLLLLILFARRPEVAAAGWGLLAFGDGAASVAGRLWGRRTLPWNRDKTWAGLLAYWLFGGLSIGVLVAWTAPGRFGASFVAFVAAAVALLAALLESLPQRLDDNLTVPPVAALGLLCLLWTENGWSMLAEASFQRHLLAALGINVLFAAVGFRLKTLAVSGAAIGCVLGTAILTFTGWRGYLVLVTFFLLGSLTTRLGYEQKARRRLAEGRGGRRRAANALANGAVAAACALFAALTPFPTLFTFALIGSLAAAAADTVESEVGQLWGRPTFLITTLRRVEPGTDGGVSRIGTLSGLVAASLTVGAGWVGGLVPSGLVLPLAFLAVLATLLESVAGATLERADLLDNDGVNFLNTLLGALLGAVLAL